MFKINNIELHKAILLAPMEDVTDIILNIKSLVVRLNDSGPRTMKVSANKAGVITAANIAAACSALAWAVGPAFVESIAGGIVAGGKWRGCRRFQCSWN
jgi:hypothetical protein